MGGSQVYLEENETMSVFELFKCIAIASANDACVVVAENIAGSHEEFVSMMNEKAKALKLKNTHFVNCTGLHDKIIILVRKIFNYGRFIYYKLVARNF